MTDLEIARSRGTIGLDEVLRAWQREVKKMVEESGYGND